MEKKLLLGSHKEPFWTRPWRLLKTIFFVFTMLASLLLVCAPPLLVVGLDLLLPPALLSAALRSGPVYAAASPPPSLYDQLFASFDFRSSLVDLPAVSAARALLVLCAYALCGGRGAYLAITAICSAASIGYVSIKAVCAFGVSSVGGAKRVTTEGKDGALAVEALFLSSLALAVAHVAVAYRTSCRERRKLLVYRIDIEAVKQKEAKLKEQIKL
ncbi:uncharacterized protein LOC109707235 [Ananas comosus]|uniref:Uncharacterized protein LOC109707235 n=1 Tax=Ananas comosus TaxID=4615 RepID=A0A199UQH5_ANACO|nr:uncharacterized protein LOC109707235 [Ananas comosus]OAY67048.1 hypothetical protein ACMD2_26195 [Ananas comosus]